MPDEVPKDSPSWGHKGCLKKSTQKAGRHAGRDKERAKNRTRDEKRIRGDDKRETESIKPRGGSQGSTFFLIWSTSSRRSREDRRMQPGSDG